MAMVIMALNELASLDVLVACPLVMLNPLIWNLIVCFEYKTRAVSRLCGGPRPGVVVLACLLLTTNFLRILFFHYMATRGTKLQFLDDSFGAKAAGYLVFSVGVILILSSFWRLGFFNTFFGDYFGILLDARITGFPFNIVDNPMYWGTFLTYVGDSLLHASAVGFLLSLFIGLSHIIAATFEGPFTAKIYAAKKT